jgi:hypothetical protein
MIRDGILMIALALSLGRDSLGREKTPIPDEATQAKVMALLREVYESDYRLATTAQDKRAFAAKLLQEASETTDATHRYVLLKEAKEISSQAGEASLAMRAVGVIDQEYAIDAWKSRAEVLTAIAKVATSPEDHRELVGIALDVVDKAIEDGECAVARHCATVALAAARKCRDAALVKEVIAANARIEKSQDALADVTEATAKLRENPGDAEANLAAGQYLCFVKGDWERGIPHLSRGREERLKVLAAEELKSPTEPQACLALADHWWDYAQEQDISARKQIQRHATEWYRQAAPGLSGLLKTKCLKRLREVEEPIERSEEISATKLKIIGQYQVPEGVFPVVVDSRDIGRGYVFPVPDIPNVTVEHMLFVHAPGYADINLTELVKRGVTLHRFKACLFLSQGSREKGSDGVIWTVEMGTPKRMTTLLKTEQTQDLTRVDSPIPKGTTHIIIRSHPGAAKDLARDWGLVVNPVILYSADRAEKGR